MLFFSPQDKCKVKEAVFACALCASCHRENSGKCSKLKDYMVNF